MFHPVKHLLLPLLGAFAVGYPSYELVKPGQPKPFSLYPLIAIGVIVVAGIWTAIVNARDRTLGERRGNRRRRRLGDRPSLRARWRRAPE